MARGCLENALERRRAQNGADCIDSFFEPDELDGGLSALTGVPPYGFGGGATARTLPGVDAGFGAFAMRGAGAATAAGASTTITEGCTTEVVVVSEVGSSDGSGSTAGGGAMVMLAVVLCLGASSDVPTTIASAVPSTTETPTAIIAMRAPRLAFGGMNVVAVLTLGPEPRATGMSCAV